MTLKRHLVHARCVSSSLLVLFGNIFFPRAYSCSLLVQLPSGRHSVRSVMGVIAGEQCMHVFHCFIISSVDTSCWVSIVNSLVTCLYQCGICRTSDFLEDAMGPS